MTDYIYSLSLASQTKGFLFSLGFGFMMGMVYDMFRLVRVSISKGKKIQIIFDIIYFILLAFVTFIFFITINEGEIRIYLLLGEAIGFAVYSLSLGTIVFAFGEKWIAYIRRFLVLLIKPFKKMFLKIRQKISNTAQRRKKPENKSKMHLKLNMHLLYNLPIKKQNPAKENFNKKEV